MIENKSYTLRELKELAGHYNLPIEISLFKDANFYNDNPKILLIQSDENPYEGHYVLLFNRDGTTYFYDPSGTKPLEIFSKYGLDQNKQDITPFYDYLKSKNVDYNNHNIQSKNSKICGLMCILRFLYNDLNTDQYYKYLKLIKQQYRIKNWDDVVIAMLNATQN